MKLQIVKKAGMETKQAIILRSAAVLLSLVFAALVIFAVWIVRFALRRRKGRLIRYVEENGFEKNVS